MYIFELIKKILDEKKNGKCTKANPDTPDINEKCEHIFLPIDSTKSVLACNKCGLVVNKNDLKPANFFLK